MDSWRNKKSPGFLWGFLVRQNADLDSGYVGGLKPFRTLDDVKRYSITFNKGFESVAGDGGEVTEYILATFLLKKAKTLAVVKPFYCSVYHVLTLS
jgi:hypothetical protein